MQSQARATHSAHSAPSGSVRGAIRMIDRAAAACSPGSMAQLAHCRLALPLLLLPGIAPGLTFMAVGVDFLWPERKKNHFSFCICCVFVFCFVFTDLFALRWRRQPPTPPPSPKKQCLPPLAPLQLLLLLHTHIG